MSYKVMKEQEKPEDLKKRGGFGAAMWQGRKGKGTGMEMASCFHC